MTVNSEVLLVDVDTDTTKVNSGNPIRLISTNITFSTQTYLQVSELPAKSLNQDHNDLLSYGDFLGFSNPVISVRGLIDLTDYDQTEDFVGTGDVSGNAPSAPTDADANPTKLITTFLLHQITKSGHVFELHDFYYRATDSLTDSKRIYRQHTLTGTFAGDTIAPIKVMVSGLSITTDSSSSKESHKITYVLNLREVRQ